MVANNGGVSRGEDTANEGCGGKRLGIYRGDLGGGGIGDRDLERRQTKGRPCRKRAKRNCCQSVWSARGGGEGEGKIKLWKR